MLMDSLQHYLDAQQNDYALALHEIKQGQKVNHWMWYIFPQIRGLGYSSTAIHYAIRNKQQAALYASHPILGVRLLEISTALLNISHNNIQAILGQIDALKLQSCMTLFASITPTETVFTNVLQKYFNGVQDANTLLILQELEELENS
jgi:uncharacterized protein (DUF1810 family)